MIKLNILNQKLPAGLEDQGAEFYVSPTTGDIKCLFGGKTLNWDEIPPELLEIIDNDMASNPIAIKALKDWNIHDSDEMLKQYVFCRFGGFDNEADINSSGKIEYTEYFDCGKRGVCKYEGKVCATIKVGVDDFGNDVKLTKRELEIVKLVAEGLTDREISERLITSEETVKTHCQNIRTKGKFKHRSAITAFASSKNLI